MERPDTISLSATARLLGVDVARVYRLARAGKLGRVEHPRVPGQEAAVPVAAVERYALRIFSDAQIDRAVNPTARDLYSQAIESAFTRRRRNSFGI